MFGPSEPRRYAPRGTRDTVVRIDLPCSPCNRIRLPPARCVGHTPDCLAGIEVARVLAAIDETLARGDGAMIVLDVDSGSGPKRIDLRSYLDHDADERAHEDAYAWIKALRHLTVDGVPFRQRFTLRGDSLWWFAELFLHKEQAILTALRTIAAFDALVERDRPLAVRYVLGTLIPASWRRPPRRARCATPDPGSPRSTGGSLARMDLRASALAAGARLSRFRAAPAERRPRARRGVRPHARSGKSDGADGSAESYIGPVLRALEGRVAADEIRYVGDRRAHQLPRAAMVGSAASPAAKRRSSRSSATRRPAALAASREIFRDRHRARRSLWASADLRAHAVIGGCDCWPLVQQQLAGIALLQFPWSARAMDEAAAALDALQPDVAVTYAEAGGWGRALALECRRRGVPLAGLQHGFIYRHWLNYLPRGRRDAPRSRQHRRSRVSRFRPPRSCSTSTRRGISTTAGRFPPAALAVTGSARLDELVRVGARAGAGRRPNACGARPAPIRRRRWCSSPPRNAKPGRSFRRWSTPCATCPACSSSSSRIRPRPPDVYASAVAGVPNIRVVTAGAALPELLAAAGRHRHRQLDRGDRRAGARARRRS